LQAVAKKLQILRHHCRRIAEKGFHRFSHFNHTGIPLTAFHLYQLTHTHTLKISEKYENAELGNKLQTFLLHTSKLAKWVKHNVFENQLIFFLVKLFLNPLSGKN
jgi:hypothetical protein